MKNLEAIEEIKVLKARYFNYLDTKNWSALSDCLTDDVTFEYPPQKMLVKGKKDLITNFSIRHATTKTAHTGSMPQIEIIDADQAKAIWFMNDIVVSENDEGIKIQQGYGYYHEKYKKINGQWKIDSILLERLLILYPEKSSLAIE